MGLPGSGKTRACLREILEFTGDNVVYLVPEQYSLQSEKNIVEISPGKATTVSVLSFKRMAFRVFSRAGAPRGAFLDDVGKVMLLRKITADLRGELNFYGKSADKQGFIGNLSDTISEFYQYGVAQEDLLRARDAASNELMRGKLTDLWLIYRRYAEILRANYFSLDEALDFLPDKILNTDELTGARVWVDGFHGFTAQERKVLERIMQKARQVTITVTVNGGAVRYDPLRPYDFFYETKRAANQITKLAEDHHVEIDPPVFLNRNMNNALDFFRHRFFELNAGVYNGPASEIGIFEAYDRESEVEAAAEQIIGLLRDNRARYRDIAVLTGDMGSYEKKIRRVFGLYGIPFFIDVRADIMRHPLVELIRAAVETASKRMAYEGVFRFLRTDMTGIVRSDVDELENYVLGYGVKGYQWAGRWDYGEGAERADRLRVRVLDALNPFVMGLPAKRISVREYSERIFNMLERLKVNETLETWAVAMTSAGDNETARRHSQIWMKVCAVFDKLVETLGDSVIAVAEFGKILDAGFSTSDMGVIPPSLDQVVAGDLTRSRLPGVKALIVLGANEGALPAPPPGGGLLNDEDRVFLTQIGIEAGSDGRRRSGEDRFLTYVAMAKPSGALYLLYSRFDGGKELKPANCVDALLRMFPKARLERPADGIVPARPMLARMGVMMRRYMSGEEMSPDMRDVYGLLKSHDVYGAALSQMENVIKIGRERRGLSERSAMRVYGSELITSVSRLERYVECPFAYFMRYNLKARERRLYTVDPLDTGNLFHNVLEMFSRRLSEAGESWSDLTRDRINALTDMCVDALSPEIPAFFSTARFKYLLARIRRICKRSIWALAEHIKQGAFEPYGAEIAFSYSGALRDDNPLTAGGAPVTAIHINLNRERKMTLTGRIDRVDIFDSGGKRYIKIIDYKSGNKKFSLSDVYFGMQLQLLLYMDALIQNGRELFGDNCDLEIMPGGVFYFNINDPVIDEPRPGVSAEESLLACFKLSGLVLADKTVVDAMDSGLEGESAIIPVSVRKTDGGFGASSSVMDNESFSGLRARVNGKIASIGGDILSGNIEAFPYKKGGGTACDYCIFGAICSFEADNRPGRYNVVSPAGK
jgi:ATP-dependent helicase/nuclease subunit B